MTRLEEVAGAVAANRNARRVRDGNEDIGVLPQDMEDARAAILALREPSEAQYEALSATGKMWRELNSTTVWQTYIDAILNEKPT